MKLPHISQGEPSPFWGSPILIAVQCAAESVAQPISDSINARLFAQVAMQKKAKARRNGDPVNCLTCLAMSRGHI